jgi:hypothetical protein
MKALSYLTRGIIEDALFHLYLVLECNCHMVGHIGGSQLSKNDTWKYWGKTMITMGIKIHIQYTHLMRCTHDCSIASC